MPWKFSNSAADTAELRISGDIIDDDDAWIYEWFGIPAAAPNVFRNELANQAGKNIEVWIDSNGGSVFAATGMFNALMQHKNTGATVTTIGDSKVMSAATVVFAAGDKRKVSPGCLFMIHNPLTYAGGYATDLRKAAEVLDTVKESIMAAYQTTSNLDADTISAMMDDETYMSAKTALKNGFATEILYAKPEDVQNAVTGFSFNRLSVEHAAAASMKRFFALAQEISATPPNTPPKNEEDTKMDVNELKTKFPEVYNSVYNAGITDERSRQKSLDGVQLPGFENIVNTARESGATAEQVSMQIIQAQKQQGEQFLQNRQHDSDVSNLNKIPPAPLPADQEAAEIKAAAAKIASYMDGGK
jgi:ATP-dependent protease ClpP protease subunit